MIGFNQLSMAYGEKLLFVDATLTLSGQKHYALVGANGTGKTTLLRLINGEEVPLSGEISTPKDATIGWLKQDQFRYENNRIIDVVAVQHLHRRMHITQRDRNEDGRTAIIRVGKRIRVGTRAAA